MSPIDYLCRDCGSSFEVGVGSLLSDDFRPGCPSCESDQVGTDWNAVVRRFGEPGLSDEETKAAVPAAARQD
jgi:DNA-directed RNA polymerase subunit RPC12/RpoP